VADLPDGKVPDVEPGPTISGTLRSESVAAASPAMWSDPDEASTSGFADAAEYEEYSVLGHQAHLAGIDVRIDCGKGDPFLRSAEDYVDGFDGSVIAIFDAGGHDEGYWRRVLPGQLRFLGNALG